MGMVVIQPFILVAKLKKTKTRVPTLYWLKARFIANSSSCTTTDFS